jgi:polyhydroxyalkanoate synthesis repressor PhaR
MDENKRIIKKYPNRRLYDTVESKYITLADVRGLVLEGVEFCVKDQKTGEDITRSILLQIISEQEGCGEPIFSTDALTRIIRFYGDTVQGVAASFLEQSLSLVSEQQRRFHAQINEAVKANPLTAMTELTQRNLELIQKMQESFFKSAGRAADGEERRGEDGETAKR